MMNGIVFRGKCSVAYEECALPSVFHPQDAIIKVRVAAVCGSDLHSYNEREKGLEHGTIMGHEFMGEVHSVGSDVSSFSVGDRVAVPFTISCGSCYYCVKGLTSRCTSSQLFGWKSEGQGLHGGQAEYVRVPLADSTLFRVPASVSDEQALFLCDILPTGFHCASSADLLECPDGTHCVVGCGPVGLMAIMSAMYLLRGKSATVFAIDRVPERLEAARGLGAVPINFEEDDALKIVQDATEGRGADSVMEAVGLNPAVRLAYDLLRPGGTLASIGAHTDSSFPFSPVDAYDKNITFRAGRCPARHYMATLCEAMESGAFPVEMVVSHRMALEDGAEAYRIFNEKLDGAMKILLLTPNSE